MELGFGLPVSGSWARPNTIRTVACLAEELGYSSLWTFQRLLVPPDSFLGPQYQSVLDPLVAMSFAAGATDRIRLAVGVINMPFSAPILLGKQFASLDVVSNGRLIAGLGLGWMPEEFVAVGADPKGRGRRSEEYLECLRAVWADDPVSFSGEYYQVPTSTVLPKPIQRPGPPVLFGGIQPVALERAGRIADGWISNSRTDLDKLSEPIAIVRGAAERAGRDPESLAMVCRGGMASGPRSAPLTGTPEQIRDDIAEIAGQGITELFLDLNFDETIGNTSANPDDSLTRAIETLHTFAPSPD
jgi:probable F420-dependent oxidoreductase